MAHALPGDFRIFDDLVYNIKPWFRSNCWNPKFVNAGPTTWVDFGTIAGSGGQFTWYWTPFMRAGRGVCDGVIEFTYTVPALPAGTPACGDSVHSNLTISVGRVSSYDGVAICVDPGNNQ